MRRITALVIAQLVLFQAKKAEGRELTASEKQKTLFFNGVYAPSYSELHYLSPSSKSHEHNLEAARLKLGIQYLRIPYASGTLDLGLMRTIKDGTLTQWGPGTSLIFFPEYDYQLGLSYQKSRAKMLYDLSATEQEKMGLSSQEYSVFGLFKVYKSLQITSGFTRFYYKSLEAQGFHRDELKLDPSGTSLQIGIRVSDI